jgi:anti-anti-sigma factor
LEVGPKGRVNLDRDGQTEPGKVRGAHRPATLEAARRGERVLELVQREQSGWTVVAVNGRLDTASVDTFTTQCSALIDAGRANVVLDLAGLQYVSSAGLSSILGAAKRVQARSGRLAIAGLSGLVKEVFSISGFETVLATYPDVETAIQTS